MQVAVAIEDQVLRLNVAMNYAVVVDVLQGGDEASDEEL